MQGCDVRQADFRGADMRQVNLGGAYLEGAVLPAPDRIPSPSEVARNPQAYLTPGQQQNGQSLPRDRGNEKGRKM